MSKNIVIGGGSGFIGTNLAKALCQLGYSPILISRQKTSNLSNEVITWNDIKQKGLPDCYAVIGLQGQNIMDFSKRWTQNLVWESRIATTQILRDAIISKNKNTNNINSIKLFISSSAISYYEPDPDKVYDESYKPNDTSKYKDANIVWPKGQEVLTLTNLCHHWERAALDVDEENKKFKPTTVIIRTGLVLGPDGGLIKNMLPSVKFYLGNKALGTGEQWCPWIHVDDLVGIFVKCLSLPKSSQGSQEHITSNYVFNGVAPNACKNHDFHSALASALGRPLLLPAIPEYILTMIVGPVRAQLITRGQHVIPKATLETLGYTYKYNDIRQACDQICSLP